ncbi:RBBP9/YdeN family alpha/beta hydrolase [Devosia sp.]|uniref:RBBP9/YdeN family alpha/beta hydrolase n=1 Tax=Devosia sp. TaxID=1871048 RepID=UPI003BA8F2CC
MKIADADILLVPGLGNSEPTHWQRRWADRFSTGKVIEQDDWDNPDVRDWTAAIVEAVETAERPVVLVAHSLGVSALVHAAARFPAGKVRGALLVSPPDHESDKLPAGTRSFDNVPRDPLPFPSLLVASSTDPFVTTLRAADMASAWGSELHHAGDAGHINLASGHGPWPEGLLMFTRLMQRI